MSAVAVFIARRPGRGSHSCVARLCTIADAWLNVKIQRGLVDDTRITAKYVAIL